MYINWNIDEDIVKNIITALSSELSFERYRKDDALRQLNEAKDEVSTNESLRETINQLNEDKRQLELKLEGSQTVIDDLMKEGKEKDANIKQLLNENDAFCEEIRALNERIEKLNKPVIEQEAWVYSEKLPSILGVHSNVQG